MTQMTPDTPLDHAHAAMEAAPEDSAARLRFYDVLSGSEVYLLLEEEPEGETIKPRLFPVEDQTFALVFDTEARLAHFAEGEAPYAALSGRVLAQMLDGQGIGLGVNLTVAPSEMLLPPDAVSWLTETLSSAPDETEARIEEVQPPRGLPENLLVSLDARLASAAGLAKFAYLVAVKYEGGAQGHMLGVVDPVPGAEPAIARAVHAALTFSGIEAGMIDVAFFRPSDPVSAQLAKVGLRFDLPEPEKREVPGAAPGMDPTKPPKLR